MVNIYSLCDIIVEINMEMSFTLILLSVLIGTGMQISPLRKRQDYKFTLNYFQYICILHLIFGVL